MVAVSRDLACSPLSLPPSLVLHYGPTQLVKNIVIGRPLSATITCVPQWRERGGEGEGEGAWRNWAPLLRIESREN